MATIVSGPCAGMTCNCGRVFVEGGKRDVENERFLSGGGFKGRPANALDGKYVYDAVLV